MTPPRLYINIDHVATVRQARRTDEPDPVQAAVLCEAAGADGITVHLREDRRHIQDHDVERLAEQVQVLNLELATSEDVVALACRLRPYQATLVPERREEITTEGGLDLGRPNPRLRETIRRLEEAGCRVSLFIDPEPAVLDAAKDLGVPAIELHTGRYATHLAGRRCRVGRAAPSRAARGRHGTVRPRRPRPHLPERRSGGADSGDRGAQHRPQHREPGPDDRDARRGGRDAPLGQGCKVLIGYQP